jgi:predicted nucleic-acid-binding Zn-ribbon protein
MPSVGFEPTSSEGERPRTYALDCAATGTGKEKILPSITLTYFVFVMETQCVFGEIGNKVSSTRYLKFWLRKTN